MAEKQTLMGAVGERDAVTALRAVGMRAVAVNTPEETAAALHRLAKEGVRVIFITEGCAQAAAEAVDQYKANAQVAVIPIPGSAGSTGYGMARVKANAEKAIGADILFNNEKEGG